MEQEQARKRGRPPKKRDYVLYRSGNRIKAWNPVIRANVNISEKDFAGNVFVYDGLGFDWVNWNRETTRNGFYNGARRSPFRKAPANVSNESLEKFEKHYREYPVIREFADLCVTLFDGREPETDIILEGSFWMRVLANIFIREAGTEGISRNRFERPEGKIWASVNVLPSQGPGYNYTEEAWYAVVNMVHPPVFSVYVSGKGGSSSLVIDGKELWGPRELAEVILAGLWKDKGTDSCKADAVPPVASVDVPPCEETSDTTPPAVGDSDAIVEHVAAEVLLSGEERENVVLEQQVPPADGKIAEETPNEEAPQDHTDNVSTGATPTVTSAKTWGELKKTQVWLKGLSSSKELQAPAPMSKVIDTIISHDATKRMTDECRAIADKKTRNEYKRDNLHVWYPSASFAGRAGGSAKENVTGYTGIACLDFDGMGSVDEAENTRDDLFMEFPEILFAAVSASGLGVYALVMLDFDGSEAGYKAALSAAFEAFESKGYMPDTGCVDPTRARYMSADADALQRPDGYMAKAFSGSAEGGFILPASMLRTCWTNSGRKRKGAGKAYLDEALRRIEIAPDGMKDTTITSAMGSVARLIRNYGLDPEKTYDRVRQVAFACGYDTKKTEDKIRRLGVKNEGASL